MNNHKNQGQSASYHWDSYRF